LNPTTSDGDVFGQLGVRFQTEPDKPLAGVDTVKETTLDVTYNGPEGSQEQRDGGVADVVRHAAK
jgi:hypothetical protein